MMQSASSEQLVEFSCAAVIKALREAVADPNVLIYVV